MSNEQKDKRLFVSTVILVVLHVAGIIGIHSAYKDLFLMCTPFNLLLSIGLLFWNHTEYNKSFFIFSLIVFLSGYFIEFAGIKTGSIFGNYSYGSTLGIKLFDVPVIIGVNWLLLIYCVGIICNRLPSMLLKSLLGAAILVVLDFFIETVAVKYDFWSWDKAIIPFQNYVAWFIVSFIFLLLFNSFKFKKENKLATSLFIIQLVFFVTLALF